MAGSNRIWFCSLRVSAEAPAHAARLFRTLKIWSEIGRKHRPIYPVLTNVPVANCFRINLRLVCFFHGMIGYRGIDSPGSQRTSLDEAQTAMSTDRLSRYECSQGSIADNVQRHVTSISYHDLVLKRRASVGFFNWLEFIVTAMLMMILYEKRPASLFWIDSGFQLISLLIMCAIVAVWV
jgi:hypothetical protein